MTITEQRKKYRENLLSKGLCNRCGKQSHRPNLKMCQGCQNNTYLYHRERRHKIKIEVMNHYGSSRCACCGETEFLFLQIDHVNGNGNEHRRETGRDGGQGFYEWLKSHKFPEGYQVLCANCNIGKHMNNGVCPHASRSINQFHLHFRTG